jgi:DNA replication protein DnaC
MDELGYLTLKPEQINAFFKLIGERYGKATTIITTNLDYPDWYELFQKRPQLTDTTAFPILLHARKPTLAMH